VFPAGVAIVRRVLFDCWSFALFCSQTTAAHSRGNHGQLPCINQVDEVKLLRVYLTNTFSFTAHVNHLLTILTIGNQRLFLLSQLKNQGLALDSLHVVYQAIIQSKTTYAVPAFTGQLTAVDITRFDALARKAKRCGLAKTIAIMSEIIEDHDDRCLNVCGTRHTVYIIYYPQYGLTLLKGLGLEDIGVGAGGGQGDRSPTFRTGG